METCSEGSFHNNSDKMTLLTSCFHGAVKRSERQSNLARLQMRMYSPPPGNKAFQQVSKYPKHRDVWGSHGIALDTHTAGVFDLIMQRLITITL